jgi:predicted HAD superfamily phosphohydrolase
MVFTKRKLMELIGDYDPEQQIRFELIHNSEEGDLIEPTEEAVRVGVEGVVILIGDPYFEDGD